MHEQVLPHQAASRARFQIIMSFSVVCRFSIDSNGRFVRSYHLLDSLDSFSNPQLVQSCLPRHSFGAQDESFFRLARIQTDFCLLTSFPRRTLSLSLVLTSVFCLLLRSFIAHYSDPRSFICISSLRSR